MKFNLNINLKDLKGDIIAFDGKAAPITDIIGKALVEDLPNDNASKEDKIKRYALAVKLVNAEDKENIELDENEIVLIKEKVCKLCNALIYGQIDNALKI